MRRFDLDGDAKLNFQEFAEALMPIQPDVVQNPFRFGRRTDLTQASMSVSQLDRSSQDIRSQPQSEAKAVMDVSANHWNQS